MNGLQVAMMKFVGFDDEEEIRNVVVLYYHIDEMGFRLSEQLSLSPRASDHWWYIVIIVNDGGAARMYCRNKVRWCIIIINDCTSSLRHPLGCIGGQDGLSVNDPIPHMNWFLINIRVIQRCGRWWVRLLGNSFAKEDMVQWLDGLELIWGCLLDAFYGHGESVGCLEDAISGSHPWNGNGMMFLPDHVHDTFATGVTLDDLDAPIMLEGRTDVPHVQLVKTL